MQYILTKEEFNNLVSKEKYEELLKSNEKLVEYILNNDKFNCIYAHKDPFGYCDFCPIYKIDYNACKKVKHFSK